MVYCKSGNFRENFIFANSVKRHICDVRNSRLGHDLPISVNVRLISPFREDSIFTKLRISRKKNASENFRIYSYLSYATYIDVDCAQYEIMHAKVGKDCKSSES